MNSRIRLSIVIVITLVFGTIYFVAQQAYRLGANDPQIELAEEGVTLLNQGKSPGLLQQSVVDPSASLSPFLIVYDNDFHQIGSGAEVPGHTLDLPTGVLQHTKMNHQSRVTWQPWSGLRIAAVVVKGDRGYVLAGRSLKEIEAREDLLSREVLVAWLVTLGVALFGWQSLKKKEN